ncbi:hypothetical protein AB0J77_14510 [Micromonospora tulbaghiae]|uniref:hypothetical protein n=1 Tax=Micromonospora tulbaghiae TaxID=479978 RepID=UPI00343C938E
MTGPLTLADLLAHTGWTRTAPHGGDDLPPPTPDNPTPGRPGPCHRPTVDELCADSRAVVAELHAAIARSRQARGADLPEVA